MEEGRGGGRVISRKQVGLPLSVSVREFFEVSIKTVQKKKEMNKKKKMNEEKRLGIASGQGG